MKPAEQFPCDRQPRDLMAGGKYAIKFSILMMDVYPGIKVRRQLENNRSLWPLNKCIFYARQNALFI